MHSPDCVCVCVCSVLCVMCAHVRVCMYMQQMKFLYAYLQPEEVAMYQGICVESTVHVPV